jgi:TRAP-type C4-dicarboxylate transport system permease small subunit
MGCVLLGGMKILPFVHVRVAATLPFPMSVPYCVMPLSAALIIFYMLVHLLAAAGNPKEPS